MALDKIREALEYYASEANNQHNYKSLMGIDDTVKAKEALAELDQIQERLESGNTYLELISKINEVAEIKLATLGNPYIANPDEIAKAAINTISKQLKGEDA